MRMSDAVADVLETSVTLAALDRRSHIDLDLLWVSVLHTIDEDVALILEDFNISRPAFLELAEMGTDFRARLGENCHGLDRYLRASRRDFAVFRGVATGGVRDRVVPYLKCFDKEVRRILLDASQMARRRRMQSVGLLDMLCAANTRADGKVDELTRIAGARYDEVESLCDSVDHAFQGRPAIRVGRLKAGVGTFFGMSWAVVLATSIAAENVSLGWLFLGLVEAACMMGRQVELSPEINVPSLRVGLARKFCRDEDDLPQAVADLGSAIHPGLLGEMVFGFEVTSIVAETFKGVVLALRRLWQGSRGV
jgi:hypothetical protein